MPITEGVAALISGLATTAATGAGTAAGHVQRKKAQKRAHKYELENMQVQNEMQRGLAVDSVGLMKQGMQNAGYSTADPNGTGVTAPSQGSATTSALMDPVNYDFGQNQFARTISDLAQARSIEADTRLKEIEERYRAKLLEGQIGEYNAKINQIQDTLPETVNQIKADIELKRSQKQLTDKQADQVLADTDRLKAIADGVKIDNDFKPDLNQATLNKLNKEVFKLSQEGKIKQVHAKLASLGILVGADDLTQLAAIVTQGKATEILQAITDCFGETIGKLPEMIGQLFTSMFDGLVEGAVKTVKSINPFKRHLSDKIEEELDRSGSK